MVHLLRSLPDVRQRGAAGHANRDAHVHFIYNGNYSSNCRRNRRFVHQVALVI